MRRGVSVDPDRGHAPGGKLRARGASHRAQTDDDHIGVIVGASASVHSRRGIYRTGGAPGTPTLVERVVPVDLQNEHYMAQLIERLLWALIDAERLEDPTASGTPLTQLPRELAAAPRRDPRTRVHSEAARA